MQNVISVPVLYSENLVTNLKPQMFIFINSNIYALTLTFVIPTGAVIMFLTFLKVLKSMYDSLIPSFKKGSNVLPNIKIPFIIFLIASFNYVL
jgi:hypothetical protein